jgi:hypothetical protein
VPLVIHKEYSDGSIEHEPFSRSNWEESLACRKHYSRLWAHSPNDCTASAKDFERIKSLNSGGPEETSGTQPGIVLVSGSSEFDPPQAPPTPLPIEFPPPSCGNALTELQFVSQLSGLSVDDARQCMLPKIESKLKDLPPATDRNGQFLFFLEEELAK